jgi:hypothetical protein
MNKRFILIFSLAISWLAAWAPSRSSPSDVQATGSSVTRTTGTTGRAREKNGSPEVRSYSTGYARNRSDQRTNSTYRVGDPVLRLDETRSFYRDYKQYLRAKEKALKTSEVPAQRHPTTTKSGKPASTSVQDGAATVKKKRSSGKRRTRSAASRDTAAGGQATASRAKALTYQTGYVQGGQFGAKGYPIGDLDFPSRSGRTWKPD